MKVDESLKSRIKEVLQTIGEYEFPTSKCGKRHGEQSRTALEVIGYEKNLKVGNVPIKKAQFRINGQMYTFVFYLYDSHPSRVELYMENAIIFISNIRSIFEWSDKVCEGFFFYDLFESNTFNLESTQLAFEALERAQQVELEYLHKSYEEDANKKAESASLKRLDQLDWSSDKDHREQGAGS